LRRRSDVTAKKLQEELFPITVFVQRRYDAGVRLKVRWLNGNQQHDAKVLCSGGYVDQELWPRYIFLEVTTVAHEKDYLRRELLDTKGGSFGVGNIIRDKKTKEILNEPYVYKGREADENLLAGIRQAITKKATKTYPEDTILVVQCHPDRLTLLSEWEWTVEQLRSDAPAHRFREVLLIEALHSYTASLYPQR